MNDYYIIYNIPYTPSYHKIKRYAIMKRKKVRHSRTFLYIAIIGQIGNRYNLDYQIYPVFPFQQDAF